MAATPEPAVWIGFMDIVPVVGTVKEAVELVLALYEGNEAVIREKNKAVENIVKTGRHVKMQLQCVPAAAPAAPAAPVATAAAAKPTEYSGLVNVREVKREHVIEYVKGARKGKKPPISSQATSTEKRLQAIREEVRKHLGFINIVYRQEIKIETERSERGEHVFNNNILRFHSNVLDEFINHNRISTLQGYNEGEMTRLGQNTLSSTTKNEIQIEMVVHFENNEFYVNANAVLYGAFCGALREAFLVVLNHININDVPAVATQRVNDIIDYMNNYEIYVDSLAKARWIANDTNRRERFQQVKDDVVRLFREDRGVSWCRDVLRVVAPLFRTAG